MTTGLQQAEYAMQAAFARRQPPTQWQITVMLEWARRFPNGGPAGMGPVICHCIRCQGDALIIPGDPAINTTENNKGYCICRVCSAPTNEMARAQA